MPVSPTAPQRYRHRQLPPNSGSRLSSDIPRHALAQGNIGQICVYCAFSVCPRVGPAVDVVETETAAV